MKKIQSTNLSPVNSKVEVIYGGNEPGQALHDLMEIMRSVKTIGKEAKLNATTISDGRGGRIRL